MTKEMKIAIKREKIRGKEGTEAQRDLLRDRWDEKEGCE
jgi:hypothetical protein